MEDYPVEGSITQKIGVTCSVWVNRKVCSRGEVKDVWLVSKKCESHLVIVKD